MIAPLQWLKSYVDIDIPVAEFTERMIMTGSEVEGLDELGKGMEKVLVGRITSLEKHPNADRLQVCKLDVGESEPIQIVTGAPNVFAGALVPVAMVGADLPCGLHIKKSKLRGIESDGMLCSGAELGIGDDVYPGASVDGIIILHEDVSIRTGMCIRELLGMDDTIIEFKTTANRPDCVSVFGMAREAAVTLGKSLRIPAMDYTEAGGNAADEVTVTVQAPDLCPRYMARIVKNVRIAPSPEWMRRALTHAGVRPINNIVDITNYVMLELGQPLHAFDYSFLKGHSIVVRRACDGENIITLDGKERMLSTDMLVIADAEKPVALAGIMGGEYSGIYDETQTVLFESANFLSSSVRTTSRALGIRTESSARYEKGLDPALTQQAMDRVMHLVQELQAGDIVTGVVDVCHANIAPRTLQVSSAEVNALLGQNIPASVMADILNRLYIETVLEDQDTLVCRIPTFRRDMEGKADIAEEVQRIYGYDTIPSTFLEGSMTSGGYTTKLQRVIRFVKQSLAGMGLYESMTYSFMSPTVFDKLGIAEGDPLRNAVRLMNPLGEDFSLMRTFLLPGMLQSVVNNHHRRVEKIRLFEIGRVFTPKQLPLTELPVETTKLCIGIMSPKTDFYTLKGILEAIFELSHIKDISYVQAGPDYLHPFRKAQAIVKGQVIAELGELHPDYLERYELDRRVLLAEVDMDMLSDLTSESVTLRALPKFPEVTRDLAVLVSAEQLVGPMLARIREDGGVMLTGVDIFDIYQGPQVPLGKKSVAFSLIFRSDERTLTDDEVSKVFSGITSGLETIFGAEMRR